ncbi:MAG: type I pullulanase [Flavobacteriales bacterium]|nr:type I pullulanase [Flavobacteriales bacterium]
MSSINFVSIIWFVGFALLTSCEENREENMSFSDYPIYDASDLGLVFNAKDIRYRLWSPPAQKVKLNLYKSDLGGEPFDVIPAKKSLQGTWLAKINRKHYGEYYTVQVMINDEWRAEVPGPYARAVGANGARGQIINPQLAKPKQWARDRSPDLVSFRDILLYEVHVRDFSIHEMGVTHVHLLPVFDFATVDETQSDSAQYNWGYDPQNYNVPEGSYATDAHRGQVRIEEFKSMVQALHRAGLRVVMDVVYNHTSRIDGLSFEETVPGYYYRQWEDGEYSNASACGNEVASERPMVRKFMIESLKYWVEEYHIDGFRFDLMGIHDIKTMKAIEKELRAIKPDIYLYGEGWTAAKSPLAAEKSALKSHMDKMPGIAAFSDDIRDGIKGHWAEHTSRGFVGGNTSLRESVKFGAVAATDHPQIDFKAVNKAKAPWALSPDQCIAYVSCHDNHTLYDKLKIANPQATEAEVQKMHVLSNAIVLTSQAVPFLHAGVEFLRSKNGVENSYQSPDSINQIDWSLKAKHANTVEVYQNLIAMRKAHPAFRINTAEEIGERIRFVETQPEVLAYTIEAPPADSWKKVLLIFNGSGGEQVLNIAGESWKGAVLNGAFFSDDDSFGEVGVENPFVVQPYSFAILYTD